MATTYTIATERENRWFVLSSDQRTRGPYQNIAVTLHVAIVEVFAARGSGRVAMLLVQDDYGTAHPCRLSNDLYDADKCLICEHSWNTKVRALPPKCPILAAMKN